MENQSASLMPGGSAGKDSGLRWRSHTRSGWRREAHHEDDDQEPQQVAGKDAADDGHREEDLVPVVRT